VEEAIQRGLVSEHEDGLLGQDQIGQRGRGNAIAELCGKDVEVGRLRQILRDARLALAIEGREIPYSPGIPFPPFDSLQIPAFDPTPVDVVPASQESPFLGQCKAPGSGTAVSSHAKFKQPHVLAQVLLDHAVDSFEIEVRKRVSYVAACGDAALQEVE